LNENKNIISLFIAALLVACGASNDTTNIDSSANERLFDYASPNAPDVPSFEGFDATYGQSKEAWTSAIYHGNSSGGPCYNTGSTGQQCRFPKFKQMKIVPNTGTVVCEDNAQWIINNGGSRRQFNLLANAFVDGMLNVNNIGNNVIVNTSGTGTHFNLTLQCYHADSDLGLTQYSGSTDTGINLIGGPHDPGDAVQYTSATISMSIENMFEFALDECGQASDTELYNLAYRTGEHETLHAMGFDHFAAGIMEPHVKCGQFEDSAANVIPAAFGMALGDYVGGGSASNPPNTGLSSQGIPAGKL
jgi:hypothetical protein